MIQVEIKDFQSIEHVTFSIDRFTALLGRSNIGKSAVVRAVKAAFTGSSGTAFVRHGPRCLRRTKQAKTCKCFSSVHLQTEGFDLLWEKGDAINRYTFNGQVYDRVDRGVPEFLAGDFSMVKVGDHHELIQCSDQFSPIFLLNQTGGVVAEVLSDAASLERINVALKLSERDRREAVSTRKVREQDVLRLAAELKTYEGLDEVVAAAHSVGAELKTAVTTQKKLVLLNRFVQTIRVVGGAAVRLSKTLKSAEVPEGGPLQEASDRAAQVQRFASEVEARAVGVAELRGCAKIVVPEGLSDVEGLAQQSVRLAQWGNALESRVESVGCLQGVPLVEVPVADVLGKASTEALRLQEWVSRLEYRVQAVSKKGLLEGLALGDPQELLTVLESCLALGRYSAQYRSLQETLGQAQAELEEVLTEEAAIREDLQEIGACPVCARPLVGEVCHA